MTQESRGFGLPQPKKTAATTNKVNTKRAKHVMELVILQSDQGKKGTSASTCFLHLRLLESKYQNGIQLS
jgi:hypothetical protein